MRISKQALVAAFLASAVTMLTALSAGAFGANGPKTHGPSKHHGATGHHGKQEGAPLIKESLAPSNVGDPTFHGVAPGGASWVLTSGDVRLKQDGHLDLRVKGLLIQATGTTGPVKAITASLYCGADTNTTAADTTAPVPLSSTGDAQIHDTSFSVPSTCLAPVILVHPVGPAITANLYIAADGWRP